MPAPDNRPASPRAPYVAVVGPGDAAPGQVEHAAEVGRRLARGGAVVVTGGLGGVMEAAARGAASAGGLSLGILPGADRSEANDHVTVVIATGLGELRNGVLVRACDSVIAVGGGHGTLSEIALALKTGVPVVGLGSWDIAGMQAASSPAQAVSRALELA